MAGSWARGFGVEEQVPEAWPGIMAAITRRSCLPKKRSISPRGLRIGVLKKVNGRICTSVARNTAGQTCLTRRGVSVKTAMRD